MGHDPLDLLNSRAIFVWGRNPLVTSLHLVPILKEARRRGATLVLVDPVRCESAAFCDVHVQPKVASDAHLAMAMAKVILEEDLWDRAFVAAHTHGFAEYLAFLDRYSLDELCRTSDLPERQVREVARLYARARPAAILFGWGLNKYRHSAEMFRFIDALAGLCGHIGVPGGGATHGYNTQRHFDKAVEAPERAGRQRSIPEPVLGRGMMEAADPPVRMMWVNAGNPVNQSPNSNLVVRAMSALDFVVVVDTFLTDTSDYADIFLPSTTFLEEEDVLVSWGHNIIGGVNRVIEPVGQARSDLWIFQRLAERLGFGEDMAGTSRQWLKRILAPLEARMVTVEQVLSAPVRCPVAPMVPFADKVFPSRSGKFEFITAMDYEERALPGFPLTLVTAFSKKWLISQILEKDHPRVASVRVGDETAEQCGVKHGQAAVITSPVGRLQVEVVVDKAVRRGMVVMPVGTWVKRGGGANVLTEDIMSNFGQMAAFGEARVRLEPLAALQTA
ncbi:MAG: molybdopterin-dependent oxidoreductase [Candidatus Rokubacteria bacterium]|nr:molybdopterin-dependent oxidoreductase [Candidatus Rokubacteria bacterium]